MLYDGTLTQQRQLEQLKKELEAVAPGRQILLLSVKDRDGEGVRDFYDLAHESLPYILVIRDNDELAHMWSAPYIPTADQVAYTLTTTSA
jgi:hypothetical protein